jgi:uncharacterized protein YjbJ (UPF0337 family)
MGLEDKTGNAVEKSGGEGKDAADEGQGDQAKSGLVQGGENAEDAPGKASGDERLKVEGQGDQAKSGLVHGGENAEDALKDR